MNLERVEIFISANFLIHAFHYLVYILQCPVFLSSLFLSQVIVILFHYDKFKSCNRKRLRRDEPIFLKTQFSVYGKKKKKNILFVHRDKIVLLSTITFVVTSEFPKSCLCSWTKEPCCCSHSLKRQHLINIYQINV